jgi:hypothetical protein
MSKPGRVRAWIPATTMNIGPAATPPASSALVVTAVVWEAAVGAPTLRVVML